MVKINLGINNCFAVKRWPETEEWMSIIKEKFGLDIVQLSTDVTDVNSCDAEKIKMYAEKFDLKIDSLFTGLSAYNSNMLADPDSKIRSLNFKWYEKAIDFASKLGCRSFGGHMGALSVRDFNDENRKKYMIDILMNEIRQLSKIAKEKGLEYLLWEVMPVDREILSSIKNTEKYYNEINEISSIPVYLCLDTGHMCSYSNKGYDRNPYVWIEKFSKYSPIIHIQQNDGNSDAHMPFTIKNNKNGIIKAEKVINSLKNSGTKEVTLIFEIIHPYEYNESLIIDEIKESVDYFRKFI